MQLRMYVNTPDGYVYTLIYSNNVNFVAAGLVGSEKHVIAIKIIFTYVLNARLH